MTYLAAIQPVVFVVILWVVLRHVQGRETDMVASTLRLAELVAGVNTRLIETVERERDARRDEIQTLLQRIQAPERAVIQHELGDSEPSNPYPLTEEETVKAQNERIAALAAIEQLEAEANTIGFGPA